MKNLTERGVLVFFSTIITLVLLLSLQGCSSLAPCGNLSDEEFRKCRDQNEIKRAHGEMIRSGFYDKK